MASPGVILSASALGDEPSNVIGVCLSYIALRNAEHALVDADTSERVRRVRQVPRSHALSCERLVRIKRMGDGDSLGAHECSRIANASPALNRSWSRPWRPGRDLPRSTNASNTDRSNSVW